MKALHTAGPITVTETTGGFTLNAPHVGKGYFGNIGSATQRDPHPREGGEISSETARANAKLWAASPAMLIALRGILAALTQPATFPADVEYARKIASDAIGLVEA